jgi:F0F1-type ATP synthase assembly protein I
MAQGGPEGRRFGLGMALAQAGMEMVLPVVLGVYLDRRLGWTPWLTVALAVLGFAGGLTHMVLLANRINKENDKPGPGRGKP